jgi:hypothetical protein
MKIRKRLFVALLAFFGVGLLAGYVFRDIRLDVELLRESIERMPSLVLENLEFEQEMSGDLWQVRVPLAERRDERIEVRSMDVRRLLADGKEWYFQSGWGVYSEKGASADLTSLRGTLETDTRVLNWESPRLSWSREENVFLFPKGIKVYDVEFLLESELASIDEKGVILLDKGGTVKWMKPLE